VLTELKKLSIFKPVESDHFRAGARTLQKILQAQPSMSGVGNCYDNAKAEAFFSTLKTECFPVNNVFGSKAEARSAIFEYIEIYYNNQRFHSALDYQSPRQYEAAYQQEKEVTFCL